jgi:DNA-binding Xre family transcriptional regulator
MWSVSSINSRSCWDHVKGRGACWWPRHGGLVSTEARSRTATSQPGTGIHRSTLYRIINVPRSNVTAANMDRLCRYFRCSLSDLAEYVEDQQ